MTQFSNLILGDLTPSSYRDALRRMRALKGDPSTPLIDSVEVSVRWQIDYVRLQYEDPTLLQSLEQSTEENAGVTVIPIDVWQSMFDRGLIIDMEAS